MTFRDRKDAGRRLAYQLNKFVDHDVMVLALPRGGVVVGYEVAEVLKAPLDVVVVRKLGTPGREELAMGAIAAGGVRVLNRRIVEALGISAEGIERLTSQALRDLERREHEYRDSRSALQVAGRTAILVDDGIATGSTMFAAVAAMREKRPKMLVTAVPVAARATCEKLRKIADEVVCLYRPLDFEAVGQCYEDFSEVTDAQVRELLERARRAIRGAA